MDWLYLAWGYALIANATLCNGKSVLTDVTKTLLFSAGATIVTVQILTHLGVS